MRRLISIYISLLILAFTGITACDDELDYDRYEPEVLNPGDIVLTYTNVTTYPVIGEIVSAAPAVDYDGQYNFVLDTVKAPVGSTIQRNRFGIDRSTGVVSYNNNGGNLSAGTYNISVGFSTVTGVIIHEDAFSFVVNDVPVSLSIDNPTVNAGYLQVGVIATVSYTDDSGGDITSLTYSFAESKSGFSIDSNTGAISKTGEAANTQEVFSIVVTTNLGTKTFADVLTVNIGSAPTLDYVQADGTTPLAKVTLSPWTAYSTVAPTLSGMEAGGGFTVNLPAELSGYASAFSTDAQGAISIAADAGLPDGEYIIGVVATNSGGISASFDENFTLVVATVWDSSPFISDDFGDQDLNNLYPEEAYPGIWANYTFGGANGGEWKGITDQLSGVFDGFRRFNPYEIDAGLVRTIDLTGVYALRFSFTELIGYGGAFITNYDRALYFGEDLTNAAAGSFVGSDWTPILDTDGAWQGINWSGGNGPPQPYNDLEVDLSQVSGNTLYLMWRLMPSASSSMSQNGQWILNYFEAEKASAYPAVEE